MVFKDDGGNLLTGTSVVDFNKLKTDLNIIKWAIIIFVVFLILVISYILIRVTTEHTLSNIVNMIVDNC